MTALTLYSKPGCHLCEEMKDVVERVSRRVPLLLTEIDITTDAALAAQYGEQIPVLLVDGRKAAKYRVAEGELLRILRGRGDGSHEPR